LIKISAVSYLNTIPFVYGIINSGKLEDYSLDLDVPSACASKLQNGEADIALVPVGAIPELGAPQMITNYCIGAVGSVKTVLLLSDVPLESISRIYLDFDSRTSVRLARVLAREYWKIEPEWNPLHAGHDGSMNGKEAVVVIGDKTFAMVSKFKYVYDLAEEWIKFTSLPFVFAAWMTSQPVSPFIIGALNAALEWGIERKAESLDFFKDRLPPCGDCLGYLENNISYAFDDAKKAGLEKFLGFLKENKV
jgi:chorismate dehydratase